MSVYDDGYRHCILGLLLGGVCMTDKLREDAERLLREIEQHQRECSNLAAIDVNQPSGIENTIRLRLALAAAFNAGAEKMRIDAVNSIAGHASGEYVMTGISGIAARVRNLPLPAYGEKK